MCKAVGHPSSPWSTCCPRLGGHVRALLSGAGLTTAPGRVALSSKLPPSLLSEVEPQQLETCPCLRPWSICGWCILGGPGFLDPEGGPCTLLAALGSQTFRFSWVCGKPPSTCRPASGPSLLGCESLGVSWEEL